MKPESVNILGKHYDILYVDNPSDVDIYKRDSLWGQIDYWTRTIRIYDNGRKDGDIVETILHEVLHGISQELNIKSLKDSHDDLDLLGVALADVLVRNGWVNGEEQ